MWVLLLAAALAGLGVYLMSRSSSMPGSPSSSPSGALVQLAKAIQKFEGWYPGSRAYKNNNPGNLKDADGRLIPEKDWADDWGAYKLDDKNFYVFGTAEQGFAALIHLLQRRVRQHPDWSILDLMMSYAPPSDNNPTEEYAATIAKAIGGDVNTKLRMLA